MRRLLLTLVALAGIVVPVVAVDAAGPGKKKDVTFAIASETQRTATGEKQCRAVGLARWDAVKGEKAYMLVYTDRRYNQTLHVKLTPPYDDKRPPAGVHVKPPKGQHQIGLTSTISSEGCDAAEKELEGQLTKGAVFVRGGPGTIQGRIVDEDGGPVVEKVKVTAKGKKRTMSAVTGPDGRYSIQVPESAAGRYTVTPKADKLDFKPVRRHVRVKEGGTSKADFRSSGACKVKSRIVAAAVNPKDGLYHDDSLGIATTIGLNYSCHSRQVIAKFGATETRDCEGGQSLSQGNEKYSERMDVDADGNFRQSEKAPKSQGIRWVGKFTSATTARVSFVMAACQYSGRADNMQLVSEGPFQF